MSIFNLHAAVLADYRDFVRSFFTIADERARQFVEYALVAESRLWPDFLLQVSPAYARAATVDELAAQSVLHATTARIFRTPGGDPFHLYQHQIEAFDKAGNGESYVVTSGTGSGKSLTYFLPIVDSLVEQPATGERIAALVRLSDERPGQLAATGAGEAERGLRAPYGTGLPGDIRQIYG